MKKFLLTAALILAVVVSLTAGTMASYRDSMEITSADMQAKTFSWDVSKSSSFTAANALKMAPGDAQRFTVTIKNNGDTPMSISSVPSLSGDLAEQLSLTLESSSAMTKRNDTGFSFSNGYELVTDDVLTLTYLVSWSFDGNDTDNQYIGKTANLILSLGSEQINRGFVKD